MPPAILFDVDGTLIDPQEGILSSFRYTLDTLGIAPPSDNLLWCIGPPIRDCFSELLQTKDPLEIDRAVALYREHFSNKSRQNIQIYPGILDLLQRLSELGYRLFTATARSRIYCEPLLTSLNLNSFFEKIHGAEIDGTRSDKTSLIQHILMEHDLDPKNTIMIGDRSFDLRGARNNQIRSIVTLYGFGRPEELQEFPEAIRCSAPSQLLAILLNQLPI